MRVLMRPMLLAAGLLIAAVVTPAAAAAATPAGPVTSPLAGTVREIAHGRSGDAVLTTDTVISAKCIMLKTTPEAAPAISV